MENNHSAGKTITDYEVDFNSGAPSFAKIKFDYDAPQGLFVTAGNIYESLPAGQTNRIWENMDEYIKLLSE